MSTTNPRVSTRRGSSATTLETVIVGVDDRPQSRDAAALARVLTSDSGSSRLILATGLEYGPWVVGEDDYRRLLDEDSAPRFDAVRSELEGRSPETRAIGDTGSLGSGGPAHALHDLAEAEDADAVVLGSTHRGTVGRVLPGSVGDRLLTAAPCAVAVAPLGYAERGPSRLERIVVGYDGRAESREALRRAIGLAQSTGAKLELLSVIEAPGSAEGWPNYQERMLEEARGWLAEGRGLVPGNLSVEERLVDGLDEQHLVADAAAALVRDAEGADLLVIGSRGYGPFRRVLLGGVSSKVIRTASCPVLVVPRGAPRH